MNWNNPRRERAPRRSSTLRLPEHGTALDRGHRHRPALRPQNRSARPRSQSRQEQGAGIIEERQPRLACGLPRGTEANFLNVTTVDATPATATSTQSVLGGKTDGKLPCRSFKDEVKAKSKGYALALAGWNSICDTRMSAATWPDRGGEHVLQLRPLERA